MSRGMRISRCNTLVTNIKHSYVNTNKKTTYNIRYGYSGFYNIYQAANVELSKSTPQPMKKISDDGSSNSTYDINISRSTNVTLNEVKISETAMNMYGGNDKLWGVTGTNFTKNITYNKCRLNRIDSHTGVHNLTVKKTTIGYAGLTQTGSGTMTIEDVTVKHNNTFITLRSDYGSKWNGAIVLKGNNVLILDGDEETFLVSAKPKENWDYGYNLYLPNIKIASGSTFEIKNSSKPFYIFNKSKQYYTDFKVGGNHKKNFSPKFTIDGTIKNTTGTISPKKYYNK